MGCEHCRDCDAELARLQAAIDRAYSHLRRTDVEPAERIRRAVEALASEAAIAREEPWPREALRAFGMTWSQVKVLAALVALDNGSASRAEVSRLTGVNVRTGAFERLTSRGLIHARPWGVCATSEGRALVESWTEAEAADEQHAGR